MTLVAHYPLQEDTGSTAHDIEGGNDGSVKGATVGVSGLYGNSAYTFAGDSVRIPISRSGGPFSVALWTRPDTTSQGEYHSLFSSVDTTGNPPAGSFQIDFDGSGNLNFSGNDADGNGFRVSFGQATTTWSHLLATFDENQVVTYRDGRQVDSAAVSSGDSGYFDTVKLGVNRNGGQYYNGRLSHVRVFTRSVSPVVAQTLYQAGAQPGTLVTGAKQL